MSETSNRPWKIELEHQGVRGRRQNITIVSPRGVVARCGDTSMLGATEDAALIVRAVNAHDSHRELVALCDGILECLEKGDRWKKPARDHAAKLLRAALVKAGTS